MKTISEKMENKYNMSIEEIWTKQMNEIPDRMVDAFKTVTDEWVQITCDEIEFVIIETAENEWKLNRTISVTDQLSREYGADRKIDIGRYTDKEIADWLIEMVRQLESNKDLDTVAETKEFERQDDWMEKCGMTESRMEGINDMVCEDIMMGATD